MGISVYDYLNSVLENHKNYLIKSRDAEDDFNKKTWYEAKRSFIESFQRNYIQELEIYLKELIPNQVIAEIEAKSLK